MVHLSGKSFLLGRASIPRVRQNSRTRIDLPDQKQRPQLDPRLPCMGVMTYIHWHILFICGNELQRKREDGGLGWLREQLCSRLPANYWSFVPVDFSFECTYLKEEFLILWKSFLPHAFRNKRYCFFHFSCTSFFSQVPPSERNERFCKMELAKTRDVLLLLTSVLFCSVFSVCIWLPKTRQVSLLIKIHESGFRTE